MSDFTPHSKQFADDEEMSGYVLQGLENMIHPTAIIGPRVRMGKGNIIGPYCLIEGDTVIGDNNRFVSHCCIGSEPEHKQYFGKPNQGVHIGNDNMFREFVTVNSGCEKPTILRSRIIMLRGSHVGHDSTINDRCILSCNVVVGGHSLLGEGVNMGIGSSCHQFSRIGSYAMIGMGAIVVKKYQPQCFRKMLGNPAKDSGENQYVSKNYSQELIRDIAKEFEEMEL